jgi:hypothetical protein
MDPKERHQRNPNLSSKVYFAYILLVRHTWRELSLFELLATI